MKFVIKFVLLCLLAVAIPFQGFASAAMLSCEQAPAQPVASHAAAGHDQCSEPDSAVADDASSSHGCAATCGVSAVFTVPVLSLAPLPASREVVRSIVQFVPDAEFSTLERPPRLS